MVDPSPVSSSLGTTPKRKRPDLLIDDSPSSRHSSFSFDVNGPTNVPTSGSSSPCTKVAHRFRGLALADHGGPGPVPVPAPAAGAHESGDGPGGFGGGGVASAVAHHDNDNDAAKPSRYSYSHAHAHARSYSTQMQVDASENEAMMRKRKKLSPHPDVAAEPLRAPAAPTHILETPPPAAAAAGDPTYQIPPVAPSPTVIQPAQSDAVAQFSFDPAIFSSSPRPSPSKLSAQPPPPPSNRAVEAVKSRVRKRAGTPPLVGTSTKSGNTENAEVVEPIRAALTWHEDEITVYDPDDEEDDGVGINGIGFKPTPAIAYARTMKRRQQMADYRKREEREARARRNLRRRGSPERAATARDRKESVARKVRFTETEPSMMIETI
ncbi:unnamed protein product [Discula destructiva]